MRILLTNDDGISAEGLKTLEKIAHELSDDVWIVAPSFEKSGVARSISLHDPLRVEELSPKKYHVSGTPADCVIMACRILLKDNPPDLILSGVNRGANMATDCLYSGTIGGAMEGAQFNIRSMALSQFFNYQQNKIVPWECATTHGAQTIEKLLSTTAPDQIAFNINFPNCSPEQVKGSKVTTIGSHIDSQFDMDERIDNRGVPYYWMGFRGRPETTLEGTDIDAVYNNYISVTPIISDITASSALKETKALLK